MSDGKVKDIFTKKDLTELKNSKKEEQDEIDKIVKEQMQSLIDQQQELLDSGDLTGMMFCATTKTGYVLPYIYCFGEVDSNKMNVLADMFKDEAYARCCDILLGAEEV